MAMLNLKELPVIDMCVAENQHGEFVVNMAHGTWHIRGNKDKFLAQIKQDLKSEDPFDIMCAQGVLDAIDRFQEI